MGSYRMLVLGPSIQTHLRLTRYFPPKVAAPSIARQQTSGDGLSCHQSSYASVQCHRRHCSAFACPPHVLRRRALPRRQRNSPVTRRDGVPARHNTAALSNARYPLFGRISKSHGIAPTTSYICTLKVLQPPFMSALTPSRLLSTFRTFLQIFKKSSFDRGEVNW